MIINGADVLKRNVTIVDGLNVFPVPDGDTGTNMNLSFTSGVEEVQKRKHEGIGAVAQALSKGLLMGARGNSGVILSQLFRGFAKSTLGKTYISAKEFADALKEGVETAYKAVIKPIEGTILTVAREAADRGQEVAKKTDQVNVVMEEVVKQAKITLDKTPELLPVLKKVGVVDAGGQGLLFIYQGFLSALTGNAVEAEQIKIPEKNVISKFMKKEAEPVQAKLKTEDIQYGYCTEFIIGLDRSKQGFKEEDFREKIGQYGDSLLVVADDDLVKVHIHAEEPGNVLNYAMRFGSLHKIKIENMREQHTHILQQEYEEVQEIHQNDFKDGEEVADSQVYGIIAVAMGEGTHEIFRSLGVDVVVSGGQTMNPSTEDLLKAIQSTRARQVILLPNNSNIVMTAKQALELAEVPGMVIPTKTVPQGLAAMFAFNPNYSIEENRSSMTAAMTHVKTGQVTFAVRDSSFDNLEIKEGDFIGIADGQIVSSSEEVMVTTKQLLKKLVSPDDEVVMVLSGKDVTEDQLNELEKFFEAEYPDIELEIHDGGQPLYPFIFSVE
ncbi:DAK2 domain-containing protein [Microaerobacter geothermalis]|nr:DAK2 domain-containing protein [Microaerobacter geothermalis]MCF6095059.1 DAK2 domain-containing protein [Microaerobacter geothermalis]